MMRSANHTRFVSLLLFLLQQQHYHHQYVAHAQEVTLTMGELLEDIYVEWEGNLTYLYDEAFVPGGPNDPQPARIDQQLVSSPFIWGAFANPTYSYLTGSAVVVDYTLFQTPGTFTLRPNLVEGDSIGFTAATTIYIPFQYDKRLGTRIFGCMLFRQKSFQSLGIRDNVVGSVSWFNPDNTSFPTQRIIFRTDRDFYPDDFVTCFPPDATSAPTSSTPFPTAAPTLPPTTRLPTLAPTAAPTTRQPTTIAPTTAAPSVAPTPTPSPVGDACAAEENQCTTIQRLPGTWLRRYGLFGRGGRCSDICTTFVNTLSLTFYECGKCDE